MTLFSGGFFPGGIDGTENALVLFSVAAAFLYLFLAARPPALKRTLAKTAAVGLLAALALVTQAPALLVAALAFSAVGDGFLSVEGDTAFLAGLGSFLAAHLAYAALFLDLGGGPGGADVLPVGLIIAFAVIFGAALVRKAGPLAVPVTVYVLAIAVMGVMAVPLGGAVLAGALLFIASDAVLGSEKFLLAPNAPVRSLTMPAVWVLYFAGQLAIALGVILRA